MKYLLILLLLSSNAFAVSDDPTRIQTTAGSPEAAAFVAAYGQPSDATIALHHWRVASPQDLAGGVVHALYNAPIGAEAPYFSLFIRAADGQVFLLRQGGFSGELKFFGPLPPYGT